MIKKYTIHTIKLKDVNVYVIKGEKIILIDTGYPGDAAHIINTLDSLNINPMDIDLIILTHGHQDHIGGLPEIKEVSKAKILIHKNDSYSIIEGKNVPMETNNLFIKLIGKLFIKDMMTGYKCVQPDTVINDSIYKLNEYGINAHIIHTPGHTGGSISIIFEDEAIVGDLLAEESMFRFFKRLVKNKAELKGSIKKILDYNPDKIYPGHGDKLSRDEVKSLYESIK